MLNFDRKLKLEFYGTKATSALGCWPAVSLMKHSARPQRSIQSFVTTELRKNTRHSIAASLRQSIYSRLAGYDDTNDAERLCVAPEMWLCRRYSFEKSLTESGGRGF